MQLSLIENGLDSLRKGYTALTEYETLMDNSKSEYEKSITLKSALINTHHGIEILMKYILLQKSEFLIFSNIDENTKNAYKEKNQKNLNSIFLSSNIDKVHTVTFSEAYERIKAICNDTFSKDFDNKIDLLNHYRNRLTHSEISIEDEEIVRLFDGFFDELDMYLLRTLGTEYKTLSGYSELIENKDNYEKWLLEHNMLLKANVVSQLATIFQKIELNMGVNEIKRITDINLCNNLFKELQASDFKFGMDLYNGTCSGDVSEIKRISQNHFSLFAKDNQCYEIFRFKSLIIYNPSYNLNFSPIFIFESDDESEITDEIEKNKREEYSKENKYLVEGIVLPEKKFPIFDQSFIGDFYLEMESSDIVKPHTRCYKYLSHTIFGMINIQGLNYGGFAQLIRNNYDQEGNMLEIEMKKHLIKGQ